jgi:methylmalonyl-CoA mutase N-terminal domain/subunit
VSVTAQQPYNNVVRTAVEALAAILGGPNSLHTNALTRTCAADEESAEIALRTQQVLMDETGVANVADPLGGSWYVEALTDRMEAEAEAVFAHIRHLGRDADPTTSIGPMTSGILRGIEDGWFTSQIADAAFQYQAAVEKGDKLVVGVNELTESLTHELTILRVSHDVERDQVAELAAHRAARDDAAVRSALAAMVQVARGDGNLVPPMIDAARAEATLGEICGRPARAVGRVPRARALSEPAAP